MSRIGIKPIEVPAGVEVKYANGRFSAKGPKGSLEMAVRPEMQVEVSGKVINVKRAGDSRTEKSLHGLTRTLIANMVNGVATGYEKKLEIVGVGYKADLQKDVLVMNLGYTHQINYKLPPGTTAAVEKNTLITVRGADKQVVGQVAAELRALRKPEPYKGKGVKYADEQIRRKAGKAGKAGAA
jgi:large subunit ribosomal protein L6